MRFSCNLNFIAYIDFQNQVIKEIIIYNRDLLGKMLRKSMLSSIQCSHEGFPEKNRMFFSVNSQHLHRISHLGRLHQVTLPQLTIQMGFFILT